VISYIEVTFKAGLTVTGSNFTVYLYLVINLI